jgi:hypothetical protein
MEIKRQCGNRKKIEIDNCNGSEKYTDDELVKRHIKDGRFPFLHHIRMIMDHLDIRICELGRLVIRRKICHFLNTIHMYFGFHLSTIWNFSIQDGSNKIHPLVSAGFRPAWLNQIQCLR